MPEGNVTRKGGFYKGKNNQKKNKRKIKNLFGIDTKKG